MKVKRLFLANNVCVFTFVNNYYKWYIPIFIKSLRLHYSNYDIKILFAGKNDLPDFCQQHIVLCDKLDSIHPYRAACYRFLIEKSFFKDYKYIFIADIDVVIMPEKTPLHVWHKDRMEKNNTLCYDNFATDDSRGNLRCSGMHFVTPDWYKKTENVRLYYLNEILKYDIDKGFDEIMLYEIISQSELPLPSMLVPSDSNHGIHLGKWRENRDRKFISLDVHESVWLRDFLYGEQYKDVITECRQHSSPVDNAIKSAETYFRKNFKIP